MKNAMPARHVSMKRSGLKIHQPGPAQPSAATWLINGFPASILIWTAEEWASLDDPPVDAQRFPNGIWCALRVD